MLAIVQARMSSERLPGKVLMQIAGRPMLEWLYDRITQTKNINRVIIATSDVLTDDPIEEFCSRMNISCFRGSLEDVAGRFLSILEKEEVDEFVRISGDSPLIDPNLIDFATDLYRQGNFDLVTNVLRRTFPKGQSIEVVRSSSFFRMCDEIFLQQDREHVTKAFYKNPSAYNIKNFIADIAAEEIQLSVDSQNDFDVIKLIIDLSNNKPGGWRELARLRKSIYL